MRRDEEIKKQVEELVAEGSSIWENARVASKGQAKGFYLNYDEYQRWYSKSIPVVAQLIPDRLTEFREAYTFPRNRSSITPENFRISDAFTVIAPAEEKVSLAQTRSVLLMRQQLSIVAAAADRVGSVLADIRSTVEAELFDDELATAVALVARGHLRAAGAVAGVVLERHLGRVAQFYGLTIRKRHPTIADLNDPLKNAGVYDVAPWRRIQHLADLRNLAVHEKGTEPTADDMTELVRGVNWVVKNVF